MIELIIKPLFSSLNVLPTAWEYPKMFDASFKCDP